MQNQIIYFYGRECPHCAAMSPLVEKLAKEENIEIKKLEVWHNEKNAKLMRSYAKMIEPACGGELGVPALVNPKTKRVLCGETSYNTLKSWAMKYSRK